MGCGTSTPAEGGGAPGAAQNVKGADKHAANGVSKHEGDAKANGAGKVGKAGYEPVLVDGKSVPVKQAARPSEVRRWPGSPHRGLNQKYPTLEEHKPFVVMSLSATKAPSRRAFSRVQSAWERARRIRMELCAVLPRSPTGYNAIVPLAATVDCDSDIARNFLFDR
jgi:hypothetical protein